MPHIDNYQAFIKESSLSGSLSQEQLNEKMFDYFNSRNKEIDDKLDDVLECLQVIAAYIHEANFNKAEGHDGRLETIASNLQRLRSGY